MRLIILLLFISCGKSQDAFKRCYSRQEALNYCVANRIGQTGETTNMANLYCNPRYPVDGCYSLGGL